jgi:hypothetical protein
VFGGDFWFQANRKAVSEILNYKSLGVLIRYYSKREIPEESFFHTVLCGNGRLQICGENRRYADWSEKGAHPKRLDITDIPKIRASGALFARKFRPDGAELDLIDSTILGIQIPGAYPKHRPSSEAVSTVPI